MCSFSFIAHLALIYRPKVKRSVLTVSAPLARSEIPLSAHSPAPVSAQGPFRTQRNFHIGSWTCFLFLFCLFPLPLSYCVSSVKLVLGLWFCGSGTTILPQRLLSSTWSSPIHSNLFKSVLGYVYAQDFSPVLQYCCRV